MTPAHLHDHRGGHVLVSHNQSQRLFQLGRGRQPHRHPRFIPRSTIPSLLPCHRHHRLNAHHNGSPPRSYPSCWQSNLYSPHSCSSFPSLSTKCHSIGGFGIIAVVAGVTEKGPKLLRGASSSGRLSEPVEMQTTVLEPVAEAPSGGQIHPWWDRG